MKSFFIWLFAVIIGGISGFGLSYLIGMDMYLTIGLGIIFGSTTGVTINIHRDREKDVRLPEDEHSQEKAPGRKRSKKINQKAS